jgi:flagellar hook-associated protein 3 FlgL
MSRVASAVSQQTSLTALMRRQQELVKTQEHVTSGKRILRASDDPAGAARAERALASQTRSEGLLRSLEASRHAMSQVESTVGDAVDLLQTARETVVQAGNGALGDSDRTLLADRLQQVRGQLLTLANADDGTGQFVFGGPGRDRAPFGDTGSGVDYLGTAGQSEGLLSESLPLAVDGQALWLQSRTGNGVFETRRDVGTGSTAWIDAGQVRDPAALALQDGQRYELTFDDASRYSVHLVADDGSRTPFPDASSHTHPFASGAPIDALPGMRVRISGTAQPGDRFTVAPSSPELSVFDALDRVIGALTTTPAQPADAGHLAELVNHGLRDLDQVLGNFHAVRARAGETLNRLDGVDARTQDRILADQDVRSRAEDLDMAQGISEFTTRQSAYQAALQSYSMARKVSLFDYISS